MKTATFQFIMDLHDIVIPGHLAATTHVPVEHKFTRQGDVYARVENHELDFSIGVPAHHINVVEGDAVRNAHILHCEYGLWFPGVFRDRVRDYGIVWVPDNDYAYLTHTGEHGSAALVPATWRLFGQAEIRESDIKRVLD